MTHRPTSTPVTHIPFVMISIDDDSLSGPLCAQTPPDGIVLSEDVGISQVGCPSQTLCNEGTLAI